AAAVMKAISPSATSSELAALGAPFPAVAARILPVAELMIVGLLIARPPLGAAAAAVALLVFTGFIIRAIRAGMSVSCGCLGSLSNEPVSAATVARNGVLIAMATAALVVPEPIVPDLGSVLAAVSLVLIAAVAVQLLALRYRIGRVWSVSLAGELQKEELT
ncbi:MAG: MauE/DoxX family redox-associated membrane protein, partial [Acidimicrobiales bacterium]